MIMLRLVVWMFLVGTMVLGTTVASGQAYPNKPIRIVTAAAGGGNDFTARLIAQGLTVSLSQPVIVENHSSVLLSIEIAANALADGYTLTVQAGGLWILPLLRKAPYDPVKDFSPITLLVKQPSVLVVHSSLPIKSVKELIALAKARPGELNYGSSGTGTSSHLAAELFKAMAGVDIARIAYRGGGPALIALIVGEVQLYFAIPAPAMPHVKSGRLRALAVTSAQPSALFPDLPTVAASGLVGYDMVVLTGIWAPARTPAAIINRLHQEIVRVLNRADVKKRFWNAAVEIVGGTPEQLATAMRSDMSKMDKVIKDAGIRAN